MARYPLFIIAAFVAAASATQLNQRTEISIIPRTPLPEKYRQNEEERIDIVVNECFDFVIDELNAILPGGLNIDGGQFSFEQEIFGFTFEGSIFFRDGYLNGFNTFTRIGDAVASADLGSVDVHVGLGLAAVGGGFNAGVDFNGLQWSFDPSFSLDIGVRLGVMISAIGISISEFGVSFEGWNFDIPGLDIIADIEDALIGWLVTLLGDVLVGLLEDTFLGGIIDTILQILEGEFDVCAALIPSGDLRLPAARSVPRPFLPFHIQRV